MKTYEMIYILDATAAEEAREAISKKFEEIVASKGGSVVSVDKWGTKKLAYPINYKTEGEYFVMNFEADGSTVKELERISDLSSEVLRRMITVKA